MDARSTARNARGAKRSPPGASGGGTLIGVFIGLALGLALAAVVAWTLMGGRWPSLGGGAKGDAAASRETRPSKGEPDKPRFDFYKILPGADDPKAAAERKGPEKPDRSVAEKAAAQPPARGSDSARPPEKAVEKAADRAPGAEPPAVKGAKPGDRFWLQVGSFAQEPDAESLKARLALDGWEAQVLSGTLADKAVRYRVRLGPYDNLDELNRIKTALARRGYEAAVIKH